ncbi:hypothetical protein JRO89_XS01G0080000 [Xanthoceras sorbifolium]|uniref:Uncharacterized protein n=1 Tax=Xanthoceras sorbifolium TaxID=99658 RepID=A0ABQ8III5_9ROSI|nr:hypothetical protein JRO89_XS01G0080000 [Xanthoceras sorbifolium]
MDSGEIPESESTKKGFHYVLLRLILTLVFPILAFFSVSLLIGVVAILFLELSVSSSMIVPSQCKIVSSSVDIRSSKVCELGVLNYKAKRVFYPFERSKFRCRYDYYWACVFKVMLFRLVIVALESAMYFLSLIPMYHFNKFQVEYTDHSIGQTRLALAEAPNEALPLNCRPNFGAAWLTKHKFKVNETYDCWYTSGISKVSLYRDGFFSCHVKDPSTIEMIRRYLILAPAVSNESTSGAGGPLLMGRRHKATSYLNKVAPPSKGEFPFRGHHLDPREAIDNVVVGGQQRRWLIL